MKNNIIKRIAEGAKNHLGNYDYVGVRVQTDLFGAAVGKILNHESNDWEDGVILDTTVGGVCAVSVTLAHHMGKWGGYDGRFALVLGCNYAVYGQDGEEIIMRNPVVLEILELTEEEADKYD